MDFKKQIESILKKETNFKQIHLEIPTNPLFGDYAYPCFDISKINKKSPNELAKSLEKIKLPKSIQKVEAKGPYLNFFINKEIFNKETIQKVTKEKNKYGTSNLGKNKKIMIEFSQPNTHKEFHIGHLRNTTIGDFLVKLYNYNNFKAISVNYIGDIGAHVARWIWAYTKFHKKDKIPKDKAEYLNKIYQEAIKKIEENELYKEEVAEIQKRLENKEKSLIKTWKITREWSIKEFKKIYKQLGINFDYYFYESEVEKPGQTIVDQLIKKGIAEKSDNAYLINLKKYDLDVFLIRKSDGTALYSTKDLALAVKKFRKFKIQESLYVVGIEQKHYFKQLFKTLHLMGFNKPMSHVSYGLVNLKGKKMSSRSGNVVLFKELYKEALKKSINEVKKRHKDWSSNKINKIANQIAKGSIKFSMLNQDTSKEISFNIEQALNFEGDTCPYIQYVNARINSVIKKANKRTKIDYSKLTTIQENNLIKQIAMFKEVIREANIRNKPHILTNYLLKLAKLFNEFYQNCPILNADPKKIGARLALIIATKQVIKNAFTILNIGLPEEM